MSENTEETLKRIQSHNGVVGLIVSSKDGIPFRTTMDNSTTVQFCGQFGPLTKLAHESIRDIDPTNQLTHLRISSKKHEILIANEPDAILMTIQNHSDT